APLPSEIGIAPLPGSTFALGVTLTDNFVPDVTLPRPASPVLPLQPAELLVAPNLFLVPEAEEAQAEPAPIPLSARNALPTTPAAGGGDEARPAQAEPTDLVLPADAPTEEEEDFRQNVRRRL